MFKKIIITIVFIGNTLLFGQTGTLKGRVLDEINGDGISFANLQLEQNGAAIARTVADMNGDFTIKLISPGKYDLKTVALGYQALLLKDIIIDADKTTYQDFKLKTGSLMKELVVTEYVEPLIEPDAKSGGTITREEFKAMPSKNINSVLSTTSGVYQQESGSGLSVRGCRSGNTSYYIDGHTSPYPAQTYNTEQYNSINENEFKKVNRDPLSTFSIDVDKASYSNTRRFINDGQLPPKDAVRVEEMINYFSYDYPTPKGNDPFSINMEASECPWNKKHSLIHIGLQGKKIETESLPPNNLVFLMDVSGSMNSPDKLPLLKSSFKMLVEQLRKQDRVSIVVYAGAAGLILPSTHGDEKEKISSAIDQLQAGGSTAGGQGIVLAYNIAKENFISKGNNRVILATDGDFNVGVSSDEELIKLIEQKRNDGIFLTVLGFGTGNYKDSKMEQLADKGNGNYAYVDNLLEAKKVLVKEMGGTLLTIAKDVKIQIEFNPAKIKAYRLIGYENRMLAAEDFNNDKKDAGEIGSGHTVTALYEIIPAGSDEQVDDIDPLKYQKTDTAIISHGNELMTIKFRYKEPADTTSKLIVRILSDKMNPIGKTSENLRFAASVAQFGLLLRDSKYKGASKYENVIAMAKGAKGTDEEGYRAEFVRMVETCQILDKEAGKTSQR